MGSLMTSSSSAGPIQISEFPEPWFRVHNIRLDMLKEVRRISILWAEKEFCIELCQSVYDQAPRL